MLKRVAKNYKKKSNNKTKRRPVRLMRFSCPRYNKTLAIGNRDAAGFGNNRFGNRAGDNRFGNNRFGNNRFGNRAGDNRFGNNRFGNRAGDNRFNNSKKSNFAYRKRWSRKKTKPRRPGEYRNALVILKSLNFLKNLRGILGLRQPDASGEIFDLFGFWKDSVQRVGFDHKFNWSFSRAHVDMYKSIAKSALEGYSHLLGDIPAVLDLQEGLDAGRQITPNVREFIFRFYKMHTRLFFVSDVARSQLVRPPVRYVRGHQTFMRCCFTEYVVFFCIKIFASVISLEKKAFDTGFFFSVWKYNYKRWLDRFFKWGKMDLGPRVTPVMERFYVEKLFDPNYQDIFEEKYAYQGHLRVKFDDFHRARGIRNPFWYRKPPFRRHFRNYLGQKIFFKRKPARRWKSRKYLNIFRRLVTNAYGFNSKVFRAFFSRNDSVMATAWAKRRRARDSFKMRIVFKRKFIKVFNLKNLIRFRSVVRRVALLSGNKWKRYFYKFEGRLSRVLVWLGFGSHRISKKFIDAGWALCGRAPVESGHNAVVVGNSVDIIDLTVYGKKFLLWRKFKVFKKKFFFYRFDVRTSKILYHFFRSKLLFWIWPQEYSMLNGYNAAVFGSSALFYGTPASPDLFYDSRTRIPFHDANTYRIFIQRFNKNY